MITVKDKAEVLGLSEVDTNPIAILELTTIAKLNHLYQIPKPDPRKRFKYFKHNGESFMYYSEEYLNETPLEELVLRMKDFMGR